MQFDLIIRTLTKTAITMLFLLATAVSQSAETEKVDFNFATPNGAETIRTETKVVEAGDQKVTESGLIYVTPEVLKNSSVEIGGGQFAPLKKDNETLGFFTKARWVKSFTSHQKAYVTTISVLATGLSIVVGQIFAEGQFSLNKLAAIPLVMAFSFAYRYFYNDVITMFNYKSRTPKQFLQARELAKQYLETGVRPAELKDAGAVEQLTKMYLMEVAFMGLTGVGGGDGEPASKSLAFILTSIAYTMTTTYDIIIAKKRDAMIAKNPELVGKYKLRANFASIGAAFIDNIAMMDAKTGGVFGSIVIWTGAVALNVYHFGWEKLQGFFGVVPVSTRSSCAALF
ncbi:MAG: hypothetical protein A4S09_13170 [Proteobacteria bacterium SG_bin7]|nr:MAG: hypothetical protein A4S09_13170 [Proteobacteria bacterium SG_bin7]